MRTTNKHPIFRKSAIQNYLRNMEKDVFPRFVSLPTFLFLWAIVTLFILLGGYAWNTQVPTYVKAPGVFVNGTSAHDKNAAQHVMAVLFFPPRQVAGLHSNQPVNLQMASNGSTGPQLQGTIDSVGTGPISPNIAYTQYQLNKSAIAITQPMVVVTVHLQTIPTGDYGGSLLIGQVQTGSQNLLALFPVIGPLFKP